MPHTTSLRNLWARTLGHRFCVPDGFVALWLSTGATGFHRCPGDVSQNQDVALCATWAPTLRRIETQVVHFITCSISSSFTFARWAPLTLRTLRLCFFNGAELNSTLGEDLLNAENAKFDPGDVCHFGRFQLSRRYMNSPSLSPAACWIPTNKMDLGRLTHSLAVLVFSWFGHDTMAINWCVCFRFYDVNVLRLYKPSL